MTPRHGTDPLDDGIEICVIERAGKQEALGPLHSAPPVLCVGQAPKGPDPGCARRYRQRVPRCLALKPIAQL